VQVLDTVSPVVSEFGIISFGTTTASLGWTTNELSTSTLEYGTSTNYGTPGTLSFNALLMHTASLSGLTAGTTYYIAFTLPILPAMLPILATFFHY